MISAVILTKNSAITLQRTLQALSNFDEIVIIDTGSQDETKEIARTFHNVSLYESPFLGFGKLRNYGANLAKHGWILAIDSDEILSDQLAKEILSLNLNTQFAYSFPFHNYFCGKHIRSCGWHPERHLRLYHKENTKFHEREVHEGLDIKNIREKKLQHPVYHLSYIQIADCLRKMNLYSDLFAKEYATKKPSSLTKALIHSIWNFFRCYLLKRGFLDGKEGFLISLYNSQTTFYKYMKLFYANNYTISHDWNRETSKPTGHS